MEQIMVEEFLSQLDPSLRKRLSNASDIKVEKQKTPSISLNNALKGFDCMDSSGRTSSN